jgi:hypothetical protein
MPSYHLHSAIDAKVIYTGKHVELNVAQGIHRNSTLHYKTGKLPSFTLTFTRDLTAHCAARCTTNTTRQTSTLSLAHTKTVKRIMPPATQYDSHICSYPNLWAV